MPSDDRCSVYIPSWDGYADLWPPMIALLDLHWKDRPFETYIGSNELSASALGVHTAPAPGASPNWSDRTLMQLGAIKTPFVLMMLEDWFLREKVDTSAVVSLLDKLESLEGDAVRLVPEPAPTNPVPGALNFGFVAPGVVLRTNTHATIWRTESLRRLIRAGESLWEFEVNGSVRSNKLPGIYSVYRAVLKYDGVVDGGKWWPWAARKYGKLNVGCDFDARATKTPAEVLRWRVFRLGQNLLSTVLSMHNRQMLRGQINRLRERRKTD